MTLFILEHRYRLSDKDGIKQGCTILGGKAIRPMLVAAVVVKGEVRNVRVQLGAETLKSSPARRRSSRRARCRWVTCCRSTSRGTAAWSSRPKKKR